MWSDCHLLRQTREKKKKKKVLLSSKILLGASVPPGPQSGFFSTEQRVIKNLVLVRTITVLVA